VDHATAEPQTRRRPVPRVALCSERFVDAPSVRGLVQGRR
jgi:hypothetical protein